jgi:hypothetical protein
MSARRVAAVIAVSGAAMLGLSGIASASGEVQVPGARFAFDSRTDQLRLWDTADDGNRVYAVVQYQGRTVWMYNASGPGSVETTKLPAGSGNEIVYKVCVDNPGLATCSPWRKDVT